MSPITSNMRYKLTISIFFFFFISFASYANGNKSIPYLDTLSNDSIKTSIIPQYATFKWFQLSLLGAKPYSRDAQGMDIFNDRFLFQSGIDQKTIHIIDLKTAIVLGSLEFVPPIGETCHMNNLNCGGLFCDLDRFPLLYLSQTYNSHSCFVLRITDDAKSFEVIQTINYIGKGHYLNNSTYDWFIDLDNHFIYTYGPHNGTADTKEIIKFNLPPLDVKEYKLSDDDIIDSFVLTNQSICQGCKIIDGLLYSPVGYGNSQHPGRLIIIDLEKKKVVKDLFIFCGEPEAIAKLQNNAIISSGGMSPIYYLIKL